MSLQTLDCHGAAAREDEAYQRFEDLLAALAASQSPETATERHLLERIASARWRQMGAWSLLRTALDNGEAALSKIVKYEAAFKAQFESALRDFNDEKTARYFSAANAAAGKETEKHMILRQGPNPKSAHPWRRSTALTPKPAAQKERGL